MKLKKLTAIILSIALAASLSACGGSSDSTGSGTSSSAGSSSSSSAEKVEIDPATWTEADATESIEYHFSASVNTLSKWNHNSNYFLSAACYLIFDALVEVDEEGNFIPWLAASYELADDAMSFTFTLRDDAYFQDGQKLTADDAVFTFEQIRDDEEHYPESVVKNWRDYLGEIEKVDDLTVTIHFAQPFPEFWKLVTDPCVQIIPANAYDDKSWDEFWDAPIGTGPYQVESWDSANSILKLTLRTDEHGYWGYDYTGTYTNVKNITIQHSAESTTRLASLRSGEVQLIDTIPTSEKVNLDNEGFITTMTQPGNVVYIGFACADGDIFANQKLREALSLCIDRELIVNALLDGYGFPCDWFCLETDLGYEDESNGLHYQYDVEKARQLVEESGYNGEPINFIFTVDIVNIGTELSQAIQSMAAEVGLNVQINQLENAVYDDARANHEYDLYMGTIANSLNMWYKQAHDVVGTDRFNSGLTNTELIDLGISLGETADQAELDSILKQMYEIQATTFENYLNIYWPTIIFAQSSNLENIQWHNYLVPDLSAVVMN